LVLALSEAIYMCTLVCMFVTQSVTLSWLFKFVCRWS